MGLYLGKEKVSNVASVITQNADSMTTEIQNHIADTNIYITADERTKWNTVTKMQNHITDTDIHITADERTKWNAAADNTEDFASTGVMNTNINMNNNSIKNLATPIENNDAANKGYVDNKALPTTSTSDNGKVLSVVNGAWAAAAMSSGAYIGNFDSGFTTKTLTFDFNVALFILVMEYTVNNANYVLGVPGINGLWGKNAYIEATITNNIVKITDPKNSGLNESGITCVYIAIPAMN